MVLVVEGLLLLPLLFLQLRLKGVCGQFIVVARKIASELSRWESALVGYTRLPIRVGVEGGTVEASHHLCLQRL